MSSSARTAVALFSGGLDSMLACRLIADQGIRVVALHFDIGFGISEAKRAWLEQAATEARAELHIVDIADQFIGEILYNPKHGYGSAFNPCIDCHANMFRHAERYRQDHGYDFLISGEVLGERPFSQNRQALGIVAKESAQDRILRPLSAKLLEPSLAEQKGWVKRDDLEAISGRSRKRQLQLVAQYGISAYESPAGGCLYTDPGFAMRLKEASRYTPPDSEEIKLLKIGRHLRLPEGAKLIIGRNAEENHALLEASCSRYHRIEMPEGLIGPVSLLQKSVSGADRALAAQLILTYARSKPTEYYTLQIDQTPITAQPLASKSEAAQYLILGA